MTTARHMQSTDTGRAVIVLFGGDPQREEREKRLPRRFLSALHAALRKTVSGFTGVDVLITRDAGREFRLGDGRWQVDSLSARIETAVTHCFSSGYSRVLLLAGDVVDVRRADIAQALHALAGPRRAVLGLSGDGGFYVVGFGQAPEVEWARLLRDRQSAGAALGDALRANGLAVTTLRTVDDIDTREDAERIVRLRSSSPALLRLVARLASLLQRAVALQPGRDLRPDPSLAYRSPLRGPPSLSSLL
jgi:hypothetical protein